MSTNKHYSDYQLESCKNSGFNPILYQFNLEDEIRKGKSNPNYTAPEMMQDIEETALQSWFADGAIEFLDETRIIITQISKIMPRAKNVLLEQIPKLDDNRIKILK